MKYLILVAFCYVGQSYATDSKLTLENFIEKVKLNNNAYKAIEMKAKALEELKAEAEILYTTRANINTNYTEDERPTTSAAFQGNKTTLTTSSLGVSKNTRYG